MIEVLMVDDHELINTGVAALLEGTGQYSVAGKAQNLTDAKRFIEESAQVTMQPVGNKMPQLVMLDIQLGNENGLDFITFLKNFCRGKRLKMPNVLVCSILEDHFLMRLALEMGAAGYIPKSSDNEELLRAVSTVCLGKVYVPGKHGDKMVEITDMYELLTRREKEVLALLRQGKSNQSISDFLGISKNTVANIISNIYLKTGIEYREGLLEL